MKAFVYSKNTSKLIMKIKDVENVMYDKRTDTLYISVENQTTAIPVSIQYNKVTIYQNQSFYPTHIFCQDCGKL